MAINVFFESSSHAELIAVFDNEDIYDICSSALVKEAKKHRMTVTESVVDGDIKEAPQLEPQPVPSPVESRPFVPTVNITGFKYDGESGDQSGCNLNDTTKDGISVSLRKDFTDKGEEPFTYIGDKEYTPYEYEEAEEYAQDLAKVFQCEIEEI